MKLSKFLTKFIFIIAFTSVTLAFVVSVIFQYTSFKNDLKHLRVEFTEQKKREVKNEVKMLHEIIHYREKVLRKKVEDILKERVNQAYNLAMDIYNKNIDIKSEEEIKYIIAKSLQDFKF
ncbi:MAG: cache domain-containing protein, partial [Aliarcobacter sp.]